MSQATELPPQQQAPAPKKKGKGKWILLAIVALIVIIAVATSGGGDKSSSSSASGDSTASGDDSSQAAGLNQAVRDGKFEFTVNGVDCSQTTLGTDPITTTAQGVFCVVSLNVSNIGNEAQLFDASSQKAFDAQGREFSADSGAGIYLGDAGN